MEQPLFRISVVVTSKNNLPCIELRSSTNDIETIKKIVSSAWRRQPLIILPTFTDEIKSLNSLIEKGILYKDENGQYLFTF
jgi:hypothetical protein